MMKIKIGLIGLGLMGNPMAKNILKAGFPLTVFNRTSSRTAEFKKLGADIVESPEELATKSDVIITMVTAPEDVAEVIFGKQGIVQAARKDLVVIDMSTIGPSAAKEISQKLAKIHIDFLDAPVTGGVGRAITGELTIFVGGDKKVFEKTKSLLLAMGKTLHYTGSAGTGQAVKLINNHLIGATFIALSEGMLLADTMQLDRKVVGRALAGAPVMSPMMNMYLPDYINNDHPLRFSIANLKKDLTLALDEMKNGKKTLPILQKSQELYNKAVEEGLSQENFSAIIQILEK